MVALNNQQASLLSLLDYILTSAHCHFNLEGVTGACFVLKYLLYHINIIMLYSSEFWKLLTREKSNMQLDDGTLPILCLLDLCPQSTPRKRMFVLPLKLGLHY